MLLVQPQVIGTALLMQQLVFARHEIGETPRHGHISYARLSIRELENFHKMCVTVFVSDNLASTFVRVNPCPVTACQAARRVQESAGGWLLINRTL